MKRTTFDAWSRLSLHESVSLMVASVPDDWVQEGKLAGEDLLPRWVHDEVLAGRSGTDLSAQHL